MNPAAQPTVGIGAAVQALRDEFPDLTVSKVRYWESRRLIEPIRTRGGSRRYSARDLERLRLILRWQSEGHLPLEVIADRLAAGDLASMAQGPEDADTSPGESFEGLLRSRSRSTAVDDAALCRLSGIEPGTLEECRRFGLIRTGDEDAVEIARIVAALADVGVEPRHLRTIGQAVDRSRALVDQAVATRARPDPRRGAEQRLQAERRRLAALLLHLHTLLMRVDLSGQGKDGSSPRNGPAG